MNFTEIKIGKGLGDIHFGLTKKELLQLIGPPTEKEIYLTSEEEEYLTEVWHYDEYQFSVSFDEEDGWRLTSITTNNPEVELSRNKLIPKNLNEIVEFASNQNLGDSEIEELEGNSVVITFIESSINFWFSNNKLTEIHWGVLWKNEDTPIWS